MPATSADKRGHDAGEVVRSHRNTLSKTLSLGAGSYRPAGRGGVLVQPTVGQFEAKPRTSSLHATSDSP